MLFHFCHIEQAGKLLSELLSESPGKDEEMKYLQQTVKRLNTEVESMRAHQAEERLQPSDDEIKMSLKKAKDDMVCGAYFQILSNEI